MQFRDPQKPYSMSQLRAFFSKGGCTYVYFLRYVQGYQARYSSVVWLGSLIHRLIQMAYYGIALPEAHARVWRQACEPIYLDLCRWYQLDEEYRAAGNPNTKARQRWSAEHPEHADLAAAIEAWRDEFLTEQHNWAKTTTLTGYFRWSCQLLGEPRSHLLLSSPSLVEGQPLLDLDGVPYDRFSRPPASQDEATEQYGLLKGTLAGLPVVGVPDVVAANPDGSVWIADYKVMSAHMMSGEELAHDGQLNLYVELLRQSGHIAPDQEVHIGHIYLTERQGVQQIWSRPDAEALALLSQQLQHMDRRVQAGDFLPVRGIAVGMLNACLGCEVRAACDKHLVLARQPGAPALLPVDPIA